MFSDLISVCYPGGASGNAIAYLLALSPEIWQDWRSDPVYAQPIDHTGAVHCIPSRLGTLDAQTGAIDMRDIIDVCQRFGHSYRPGVDIPPEIVEYFASTRNRIVALGPPRLLSDVQPGMKTLHACHASGRDMRMLYPGTITIAVHGSLPGMLRNFSEKFALAPDTESPELGCHIDAELTRLGMVPSRSRRKKWLSSVLGKCVDLNQINNTDSDTLSHRVDFDVMFDEVRAKDEYHAMVEFCGMTPDWPRARDFIASYSSMQPTRPYASHGA